MTPMKISSPAFEQSHLNPAEHPHDRGDVIPPLHLENAVSQAKTPVLIIDDPDAPAGKWVRPIVRSIDSMDGDQKKFRSRRSLNRNQPLQNSEVWRSCPRDQASIVTFLSSMLSTGT